MTRESLLDYLSKYNAALDDVTLQDAYNECQPDFKQWVHYNPETSDFEGGRY